METVIEKNLQTLARINATKTNEHILLISPRTDMAKFNIYKAFLTTSISIINSLGTTATLDE